MSVFGGGFRGLRASDCNYHITIIVHSAVDILSIIAYM